MICGKMLAAPLVAALIACAAPAMADSRLVSQEYDENEVVKINGKLGVQATIGFADDEHIDNVAVGDSSTWQITPNKRANLLFVKPLEPNARTNMTVVTDRRTYFFDLVASPRAKPVYMLRFTYADDGKTSTPDGQPVADGLAALSPEERAAVSGDKVVAPADPAMLNFAWSTKGDAKLLPKRIYDDGDATYLLWGDKQSVPAILIRNEKGEEGPVNYAVRGTTIVIDDVPSVILLRAGKASATLENMREPSKSAARPLVPFDPARPALSYRRAEFAALTGRHGLAALRRN